MYIEIHGLLLSGGKLFIIARNGDVFLAPQPPRLTLSQERIKKDGRINPCLNVDRAQIVCESASSILILRRMLWRLLPQERASEIIPKSQALTFPQERKFSLVG